MAPWPRRCCSHTAGPPASCFHHGSCESEKKINDLGCTYTEIFIFTFSVRVTLLRRRVENPEEHSVSVGELGQECISRAFVSEFAPLALTPTAEAESP